MKTLSIGIPAYNEESNIGNLINSLLAQTQEGFVLEKIIVASDGSTDNTDRIVRSFGDKTFLISDGLRKGQAARQNEIISINQSDLLLMLNADIIPIGDKFIAQIIQPVSREGRVGIVSAKTIPLPPEKFFEKIVAYGAKITDHLADQLDNGQNLYHCHGSVRVFTKEFLAEFRFPAVVSEDAYSYFYAKQHGFGFVYEPRAQINYRCSQTMKDYLRQSVRFTQGQKDLARYVPKQVVESEHKIPTRLLIKEIVYRFFKNPILLAGYLTIAVISAVKSRTGKQYAVLTWEPAETSKTLIRGK